MAGQPENMEYGVPGGNVILDVKFYNAVGWQLVDDDGYAASGTLPVVEIYDYNDVLIYSSETEGNVQAVRASVGNYSYTYAIPLSATISDSYKITWKLTINSKDSTFSEYWRVVAQTPDIDETRSGFAFNNPDTTSDYLAPNFGRILHPDELRYDSLFGNPLIAEADSSVLTDDQLSDYERIAIAWLETELNIDILPRLIRFDDPIAQDGSVTDRTDIDDSAYLATMDRKQQKELYIRETGYPYRIIAARNEGFLKLRRRPVRDVLTANFVDYYYGNTVLDLMPYRIVKKGFSGILYFRPRNFTVGISSYLYIWNTYLISPKFKNLQDVFKIDYETGYENCQDVPDDLRRMIIKIAGITLMATLGLGRIAGIASRSVSLNSVSESIGTTQSATSGYYGSTILQYQKEIKDWFKQNRKKYSRTSIGRL